MTGSLSHRLLLLAAAVLFSSGGAVIKACSLNSWQVASFRSLVAAVVLPLLVKEARSGYSGRVALAGIAYAFMMITFVTATKLTTSANAIFLQDTAPLYLLLIGPLFLKERLRPSDLWFAMALIVGLLSFFLSTETAASAPNPRLGNIIGAASGVGWAITIASMRQLKSQSISVAVAGNVFAFLIALPMALPVARITSTDVAILLFLGVFQIGLAYFCLGKGIRGVPAFEASALLLLEPALNPIWAWLVHNEVPSSGAIAGGAIILTATFVNTWWQSRSPSEK